MFSFFDERIWIKLSIRCLIQFVGSSRVTLSGEMFFTLVSNRSFLIVRRRMCFRWKFYASTSFMTRYSGTILGSLSGDWFAFGNFKHHVKMANSSKWLLLNLLLLSWNFIKFIHAYYIFRTWYWNFLRVTSDIRTQVEFSLAGNPVGRPFTQTT